jgi:ABC-2 type transport system permease protein
MRALRGLGALTREELKLFLREFFGVFFNLAFPLIMLFLFGSIYGNKPSPFFGGLGSVDVLTPAYMAMLIGTSGLMSLTVIISSARETGVLRRYRATPLRPQTILVAELLVLFIMLVAGVGLLIVCAKLFYHLRFAGNALSVAGAFLLASLCFYCLGFVLAGLMRTARAAQAAAMVLYFPMLFLSGAAIPREVLPAAVRRVAEFLPLTHVVNLLRGLWIGDAWGKHLTEVVVLAAVSAAALVLAVKTFRWE